MNELQHNLLIKREVLSITINEVNSLLTELKKEFKTSQDNGVEAYILLKVADRIKTIERLVSTVVDYDTRVQQYLNYYPENTPVYKERLKVAQLYVEALGGDWNTVLWGKVSDY